MGFENLFNKITKADYYLILMFILLLISISVKFYFNSSGYLSPDSTNYLLLAQNLLDNNSFYISNPDVKIKPFTIWPIGYSVLIFLIAKLTGFSVFLASKFINIAVIFLFINLFKKEFKENTYLYVLVFFFASFIQIYSYSWSESFFIFCIFWFTKSIYSIIINFHSGVRIYISILFSSLLMFLFRYIGSFSFGIIGLLGLYYLFFKKEREKSFFLLMIAVFNTLFMFAYLYNNYLETGYYTGIARNFQSHSSMELFIMLVKSIVSIIIVYSNHVIWKDVAFPLFQVLIIFILVVKYRKKILKNDGDNSKLFFSFVFFIIGLLYLISIALLSCAAYVEELNYRLLAPGSFLIFIALINYFENNLLPRYFKIFKIILVSIAFYSWCVNVPYQVLKDIKNSKPLQVNLYNSESTFVKK
ncbi:hypothetical protein AAGV28_01275 [Flavobacterium sp. FZUC8N2.13]|uniref:Glycosyltransferase RgtA/B/C/D-like domain-containing protein n=1 Tax=Flavobacterium zubiriense TaxID=3138075 RepID=A0ABV4T792_9FLAO